MNKALDSPVQALGGTSFHSNQLFVYFFSDLLLSTRIIMGFASL
jgi:hypothetical protein